MPVEGDPTLAAVLAALLSPAHDPAELQVAGKCVLLRADLNVPLDADGRVDDDNRVTAALPTISLLVEKGARVVVASHLGRPDLGKRPEDRTALSLAPVAEMLAALLPTFVGLAPDCVGPEVAARVAALKDGQVLLLENTRFHAGDTDNDDAFAGQLAELADVFVNDAFGVVHRAQASVTGVALKVPQRCPGLLVRKEVAALGRHLSEPARPFGVVIGGAKVADKLGVIDTLIDKADMVLIGGKMAFTFLAATGVQFHESQVEESLFEKCLAMLKKGEALGVRILLPVDVLVADRLEQSAQTHISELSTTCCTKTDPCVGCCVFGADIGPKTIALFQAALKECRTIFWNGPVGKFEVPLFSSGTNAIAETLREVTSSGAITVIGGGDSVNALRSLGYEKEVSHVSTGGGASLELIEGKSMPGLQALVDGAI